MLFHRGRLLDHVHLRVADLEASRAFYAAVLESVGSGVGMEGQVFSWPTSSS
jgi:catechol-2,3-dioxygenase